MTRTWAILALATAVLAEDPALYEGHPVAHWIDELEGDAPDGRRQAAYALWHLNDPAAASALARAVGSEDSYVRETAAKALVRLGAGAREGLEDLVTLLVDDRPAVRREAASVCRRLETLSKNIVMPLAKALSSSDAVVRANVAAALSSAGTAGAAALPALEASLDDENGDVRRWAAHALACIDPIGALETENDDAIDAAVRYMSTGMVTVDGLALLELLEHPSTSVRRGAVRPLCALIRNKKILPSAAAPVVLRRYVLEEDPEIRLSFLHVMGLLPDASDGTLPWLLQGVESQDAQVRYASLMSLACIRPESTVQIALIMCADPDATVRSGALYVLSAHGPKDVPQIAESIEALLGDDDTSVRIDAVHATVRFRGAEAVSPLVRHLNSSSDMVERAATVLALAGLGGEAIAAVPALADLLERDDFLAIDAAYAIAAILDRVPEAALKKLSAAILVNDPALRNNAVMHLWKLEDRAAPLMKWLLPYLRSEDPILCERAIRGVEAIGPRAADAIPLLRKLLEHDSVIVRGAAEAALKRVTG